MTDRAISIPADTGPEAALALHQQLLDRVRDDSGPFAVDVDGPQPTAIALQLAVACQKFLGQTRFSGFGPNCSRLLDLTGPALR